jgi:hypothetical protein
MAIDHMVYAIGTTHRTGLCLRGMPHSTCHASYGGGGRVGERRLEDVKPPLLFDKDFALAVRVARTLEPEYR